MHEGPILLVEDDPDDVMLTRRAFAKHHISNEIIVVSDGETALDLLLPADNRPGMDPAVVLLDLHLPKIDGLEVLRRLRADERTMTLPVVVLTTSTADDHRIASYRLGANSYVHKPVIFNELHDAARALGLFWLLVNQRAPTPQVHRR